MNGATLTAVAITLAAGHPADARGVASIDAVPDAHGRRLLIAVEPLEPSPRGFELARLAMAVMREAFAEAAAQPAAEALRRAFAAANTALLAENRPLPGCRWERRIFVGATAIAVEGRVLTVAQMPATQALIVQDGRLYAFPDLASWRCDYQAPAEAREPDPLGCRDAVCPDLFRTVAAQGDLIVLCSAAVARCLAQSGFGSEAAAVAPLLAGDLDATLERLGEVVLDHELDDAFVVGVRLGRLTAAEQALGAVGDSVAWVAAGGGIRSRPRPSRGLAAAGRVAGGAAAGGGRLPIAGLGVPLDEPLAVPSWPDDAWEPRATPPAVSARGDHASSAEHDDAGPPLVPTVAGGAAPGPGTVSDRASADPARVGALAVTAAQLPPILADGAAVGAHVRRNRLLGRAQLAFVGLAEHLMAPGGGPPRLEARALAYAAPGAGSVHLYRARASSPPEWRTRLPRGPMPRVPVRAVTLTFVLLLTLGTAGVATARQQGRAARADAHLAAVDTHLAVAARTFGSDLDASFGRAWEELDAARANGASAGVLAERRATVTAAADAAHGIARFGAMDRLGTLPPDLRGGSVRLIRAGDEVFLVGGGLYQLDVAGGRLLRLLAPGDAVGAAPVGRLIDGGAGAKGIVATDGAALYHRDDAGRWARQPLADAGAGAGVGGAGHAMAACASFLESFYALDADGGRVLKFVVGADGGEGPADDWSTAGAVPPLGEAKDLVVDGRVHVLLGDGRVLSLYQGTVQATLAPRMSPPLAAPVALDGGLDTNYLYLAEPGVAVDGVVGRVVRMDRSGDAVLQFLAPPPGKDQTSQAAARALAEVRDLVVDEAGGIAYFVTADAVWRATLPGV